MSLTLCVIDFCRTLQQIKINNFFFFCNSLISVENGALICLFGVKSEIRKKCVTSFQVGGSLIILANFLRNPLIHRYF